jgi:hypothetical protein
MPVADDMASSLELELQDTEVSAGAVERVVM